MKNRYSYIINTATPNGELRQIDTGTTMGPTQRLARRSLAKIYNVTQHHVVLAPLPADSPAPVPARQSIEQFCEHAMLENIPAATIYTGQWLHANASRISATFTKSDN